MKEGWEYKEVGDLFKTYSGGTPHKSHSEYYDGGTIPWLMSGEVCQKYITNTELYITELGLKNSSAKYYPKNTVVVAMYGATAAQVGILKITATSNQAVCGILPNDDFIPEFIYYWFTYIKENLAAQAQGGAQPNLSQIKIKKVLIPNISLAEQQQIVSFLDSEFEKIDALKANAEEQLQAAKDLFQKALKEMLTPKEGWEEKKLGDICTIKGGKRVPKGYKLESEPTKHVYIRVADFNNNGSVDVNNLLYINDEVYEQIKRYTISEEDVYISIAGTIGKAGIIPSNLNGANLTENACKLVLNGLVDKKYIYFYTLHPTFKQQVMRSTKIGAQPKLALTRLADVVVCFPKNKETQLKVVLLLERLQESIKQLQENYNETITLCNDLKQSLLKKIFE